MLIKSYSEVDNELWIAADLIGASLIFCSSETYKVAVYQYGYSIGETCRRRNSREWVEWLRSLKDQSALYHHQHGE